MPHQTTQHIQSTIPHAELKIQVSEVSHSGNQRRKINNAQKCVVDLAWYFSKHATWAFSLKALLRRPVHINLSTKPLVL
jgi:hypothetical protein